MQAPRRGDKCPPQRTLVDILLATAGRFPNKPALDDGTKTLTYAELVKRASQVAAGLRASGVQAGDRVGINVDSGTSRLYMAILGTLLAGAAYVPIDADDPAERAQLVFSQAELSPSSRVWSR